MHWIFSGFGFLDNAVMILAGDYIETSVGVMFNLSVLAAAGLGNTVSDLVGVLFGGYVESIADKFGQRLNRAIIILNMIDHWH